MGKTPVSHLDCSIGPCARSCANEKIFNPSVVACRPGTPTRGYTAIFLDFHGMGIELPDQGQFSGFTARPFLTGFSRI